MHSDNRIYKYISIFSVYILRVYIHITCLYVNSLILYIFTWPSGTQNFIRHMFSDHIFNASRTHSSHHSLTHSRYTKWILSRVCIRIHNAYLIDFLLILSLWCFVLKRYFTITSIRRLASYLVITCTMQLVNLQYNIYVCMYLFTSVFEIVFINSHRTIFI